MASDEEDVDVGFVFEKNPSILSKTNPLVDRRLTNKGYVEEEEFCPYLPVMGCVITSDALLLNPVMLSIEFNRQTKIECFAKFVH